MAAHMNLGYARRMLNAAVVLLALVALGLALTGSFGRWVFVGLLVGAVALAGVYALTRFVVWAARR